MGWPEPAWTWLIRLSVASSALNIAVMTPLVSPLMELKETLAFSRRLVPLPTY